jgi:exonuclease III
MAANTNSTDVTVLSYNSTGLGTDKVHYIEHLLKDEAPDFLFVQETWLLNKTLPRLGCIDDDYLYTAVSGVNDSELLSGRPYGGVAILWHKRWDKYVQRVTVIGSRRVCAISYQTEFQKILFICAYMPGDSYSALAVADEFLDVLDCIECLSTRMSDHLLIVGGDLNLDFARNNAHSRCLEMWIERMNMKDLWTESPDPTRFTYCDLHQNSYSCIDHWLIPIDGNIHAQADVMHEGMNTSKHSVITLRLSVQCNHVQDPLPNAELPITRTIEWHKAGPHVDEYHDATEELLMAIVPPPRCDEIACRDPAHCQQIDAWCQ